MLQTPRWTAGHVGRVPGEPSTVRPSDATRVGQGGPRAGPAGRGFARTAFSRRPHSGAAPPFTDAEAGAPTGDGHPAVTRRVGPGHASLPPAWARGPHFARAELTAPHCLSGSCPGPAHGTTRPEAPAAPEGLTVPGARPANPADGAGGSRALVSVTGPQGTQEEVCRHDVGAGATGTQWVGAWDSLTQ